MSSFTSVASREYRGCNIDVEVINTKTKNKTNHGVQVCELELAPPYSLFWRANIDDLLPPAPAAWLSALVLVLATALETSEYFIGVVWTIDEEDDGEDTWWWWWWWW